MPGCLYVTYGQYLRPDEMSSHQHYEVSSGYKCQVNSLKCTVSKTSPRFETYGIVQMKTT